ncbi:hypothetical protein ACFYTC_43740 [Actinomadura nitritigenes]
MRPTASACSTAPARAPHRRFGRVAADEVTGHAMPLSAGGA